MLPLIGSTTIGRYFEARRGRALSLSLLGLSVAEVVLPPVVTYAILAYGFGTVWALAGGAVLVRLSCRRCGYWCGATTTSSGRIR